MSPNPRTIKERLLLFWYSHWQWLITTAIAALAVLYR